jgi:hypothetical protein
VKFEWVMEVYTVCCSRNERSGLAWFNTDIWKLRGMWKDLRKGDAFYVEGKKIQRYSTYIIKMFGDKEVEGKIF